MSVAVTARGMDQAKPAQPPARTAAKGNPASGKDIFVAQRCSLCHIVNGTGGVLGPDLSAVGTRRDAMWLVKYLPNPQADKPENKMPPVAVKGQDFDDLVAYLLSLKGKTLPSTSVDKPATR